jgi:ABC-2 type transport system ATP-binding protein
VSQGAISGTSAEAIAIETVGLTKRYGETVAVTDLNMTVRKGSICGFLGPNGAGKTTTIQMLLGLSRPSAGSFRLNNQEACGNLKLIASEVVALLEHGPYYPYLTGLEMLQVVCLMSNQQPDDTRIARSLERFGLGPAARRPLRTYSQGMRQRVGLAMISVLVRPIVILDEPLNGLDPEGHVEFRSYIRELREEGRTILLSSHLLHEVQETCSDVIILNRGRILVQGPTANLLEPSRMLIMARPWTVVTDIVKKYPGVEVELADKVVMLRCSPESVGSLTAALVGGGAEILGLNEERPSLENLFLKLTRRPQPASDAVEPHQS